MYLCNASEETESSLEDLSPNNWILHTAAVQNGV